MIVIEYRVEEKYLVSDLDLAVLKGRLQNIMQQDIHQTGEYYEVRSLYFDDPWNRCMEENEAGVDCRKKYRIRTYGPESSLIRLEIKAKQNGLTRKTGCTLTAGECSALIRRGEEIPFDDRAPLNQLLMGIRCSLMRPKVIIAYERTAFVYPTGNVRITFDGNIQASFQVDSFLDEKLWGMVPVLPKGMHVLEVKYDELLPDVIARQLETGKLRKTAFSKYYLGRMAANGEFSGML